MYYAMTAEDYFMPSYCSGTKYFIGTEEQIAEHIMALEQHEKYPEFVKAFQAFRSGQTDVKIYAAYSEHTFLTPARLVTEQQLSLEKTDWDFLNVWECVYEMHTDAVQVSQAVFQIQDRYYLCIQARFRNLHYDDEEPMTGGFWGFPDFFKAEETENAVFLESRLYTVCDVFDTEQEAVTALQNPESINLSRICEEIFADG